MLRQLTFFLNIYEPKISIYDIYLQPTWKNVSYGTATAQAELCQVIFKIHA